MERSQLKENDGRVRLSRELSEGEKKATGNRKAKVQECFKSLGIACDEDNTPNIAVLGSGGGLRAMIALQGTLVELKIQDLLNTVMYLCGVSGSTWCMSTVYQEKDWTEKVEDLEKRLCDTLSKPPCNIQEEFNFAIQAAEDELFSLTDVWTSFLVYPALKQHDKTKLSGHEDTSTSGTNPYPIYAATEAKKLDEAGTWFEFTPHESGFPNLGAFVRTKDLGSKFKHGNLQEKREEKNICYLQGLWGSALSSWKADVDFLIDFLLEKLRKLREYLYTECKTGIDCTCAYCRGLFHLLELHAHASAGKDCEGIFMQLKEVLEEKNSKKSYVKCCEVSETWHLKTLEERTVNFTQLVGIFEEEHGGTDCTHADCRGVLLILELHAHASAGKDCEEKVTQLKEVLKEEYSMYFSLEISEVSGTCSLQSWRDWIVRFAELMWIFVKELGGYVQRVWKLLKKTVICLCFWRWGHTNNFLYKDGDAQSTGLTNEKFIYLIDAGIGINSAYPLVLRPERKVNLILSFDFSSGDPFETIRKSITYCEKNHIPFPKIDPEEIKDTDNPRDCYIFKGNEGEDVPTIMHFPLFNNINCPGKIEQFRKTFSTFKSSYSKEDVKELLSRAKLNVSNNKQRILNEIRSIVSSSAKK